MPRPEDATEPAVHRAQTVAPVQESTLLAAAALLGEADYTPDRELNGTLNTPARVHETAGAPTASAPVTAPAPRPAAPVTARSEPVEPRTPGLKPVRSRPVDPQDRVAAPRPTVAAPREVIKIGGGAVAPQPKGWFARLIDKLLGRN